MISNVHYIDRHSAFFCWFEAGWTPCQHRFHGNCIAVIQRTPEMGLDVVQDVEMTRFFASISRISPTNMNIKQSSSSRLLPLEFENDFSRFRFCSTIPARLFFGRACSVENLGGLVLWSLMVKGGATSRIMPHTKGKQQSLATRQQKEPVK